MGARSQEIGQRLRGEEFQLLCFPLRDYEIWAHDPAMSWDGKLKSASYFLVGVPLLELLSIKACYVLSRLHSKVKSF